MTYLTAEARQRPARRDRATRSTSSARALAALGAAYELLDEQQRRTGSRRSCSRPVQKALRARASARTRTFAARHCAAGPRRSAAVRRPRARATRGPSWSARSRPSTRPRTLLVELQDSMLPVEVGDPELRAGLAERPRRSSASARRARLSSCARSAAEPTARAARGTRCSGGTGSPGPARARGPASARQALERQPRLELAEAGADAVVDALAEREAAVRVLARHVEASRAREDDASWPDAASHRNSFAPSGSSTPPIVTARLVIRRQTGTEVS